MPAPKFPRPRVLGTLEQPIAGRKRIVHRTALVSQHAGDQADHGIHQHHGRDFAAVEHEIADGDFVRLQDVDDALIKSLVTSAEQDEPLGDDSTAPLSVARAGDPAVSTTPHGPASDPDRWTSSTASTTGSTIITMPGPPPKGRSSTC